MKKIKTDKLSFIETIIWMLFEIKIFKVTRIYFSRIMMTFCIFFFPKLTHYFSVGDKLPSSKNRIKYTKGTLNDWIFLNQNFKQTKNKIFNEEIYVFFKRESPEFLKVKNKKVKKFLVNWEKPSNGKNIFYSTADSQALSFFILNKMQPCFYVEGFFFLKNGKPFVHQAIKKMINLTCPSGIYYHHWQLANYIKILKKNKKNKIVYISNKMNISGEVCANPGSGITVILALLKHYKKVRVCGLDLYQSKKIHLKSFLYSVLSLSRHFKAIFYQQHHMENLIYQYIYLSRLIDENSIRVTGNVAKLNRQKKLIKNLKKIIYKNEKIF